MTFFLVFSLFFPSLLFSHEGDNDEFHRCGTTEYMQQQILLDPSYKTRLDAFETLWQQKKNEKPSQEQQQQSQATVLIPVVWHILYNQQSQNIPDSAIEYQLNVLNEDFSATNRDYDSSAKEFHDSRSGDTGIRYQTQQIIRKQTNTASFSSNNNIKYDNSGGSNVVDPNRFLNFWVGILSGGLLGYAQFPGGNSNTDGVVCHTQSLSPQVGTPPYNLGRTATHEIGHWLNLRHIWGDSSICLVDDGVDDTPPSNAPNYGCPATFPKRCTQNPFTQDMGCNYMDYSEDACLTMFTPGQSQRAWLSINQYRQGFNPSNVLKTSNNQLFVSNVYFNKFDNKILDESKKCMSKDDILFYDNIINGNNDNNNVYVYGCKQVTNNLNFRLIKDIKLVSIDKNNDIDYNSIKCDDGYYKTTQILNEGNVNDNYNIYMCVKYELFDNNNNVNNEAIVDIAFINNDNKKTLNSNIWIFDESKKVESNGITINLAVQKQSIKVDGGFGNAYINPIDNNNNANNNSNNIYIGIAIGCIVLVVFIISSILYLKYCRKNNNNKQQQKQSKQSDVLSSMIKNDSLNIYGSNQTEMVAV